VPVSPVRLGETVQVKAAPPTAERFAVIKYPVTLCPFGFGLLNKIVACPEVAGQTSIALIPVGADGGQSGVLIATDVTSAEEPPAFTACIVQA
jgi:hypothetical protein